MAHVNKWDLFFQLYKTLEKHEVTKTLESKYKFLKEFAGIIDKFAHNAIFSCSQCKGFEEIEDPEGKSGFGRVNIFKGTCKTFNREIDPMGHPCFKFVHVCHEEKKEGGTE